MSDLRIKHFILGILSRDGLYATLAATYEDDTYVYFVGRDAYGSVNELADALSKVSVELRTIYDMDKPEDYHKIATEFIARFEMKADKS